MSQDSNATRFLEHAARSGYATAPVKTTRMPPGVPYIVGNEAAERFSYYGMTAILATFMAGTVRDAHNHPLPRFGLLDAHGNPAPMSEANAAAAFHLFATAVYFTPFLGALLSDMVFGKYRTIFYLSIVYCFGHFALALNSTRLGLAIGLSLIALGAGGIKPCVSANVGDQFGTDNQHLLERVFGWFYFSINIGAGISQLLIPVLLADYGPSVAFAVPGILMFLATVIFWMGRRKFVHIPPDHGSMLKEALSLEGWKIMRRLLVLFFFMAAFFSLYVQSQSVWVLQAGKMDLHWLGHDWLPSQLQAINPVLVLVFIPLFSYVIYPVIARVFPLTPLRKISIGLFLMAATFLITAWIEQQLALGLKPSVGWQAVAYVLLTAAEVLVSITGLEFYYTQAPRKMKSLIMALYMCSLSLGNFITAVVLKVNEGHGVPYLTSVQLDYAFAGFMATAAVVFVFVARKFKVQTFIQDEPSGAA